MSEHEIPMHELFVSPKIVLKVKKQAANSEEKEIRSFADFLSTDVSECKRIYLVGEPGSGKSTFLQFLALKWSEQHNQPSSRDCRGDRPRDGGFQDNKTLQQINFLFFVSLRDANHHCSYEEIIRDQLLKNIYTQESEQEKAYRIVRSVLESPTTCIASEGLDEWAHPTQGSCHCPPTTKGRTPSTCQTVSAKIVTSSRPWRLAQLPPKDSMIEKRMDIKGTGSVDELGKKIVNVLNKEAEEENGEHQLLDFPKFKQRVGEQKVAHLLHTPILLLQLVCLFFDGKGIPNSQCKIYASIVDMLIGRQSQENIEGSEDETTLQVFPYRKDVRSKLMDVARVAFEQHFPKNGFSAVVFDSKKCNLNKASQTFALKCGLLTENKSKSFSSRSSHLSFTHKSFQEYFAAVYLSEHEKRFETVIEQRYKPHGKDEYRTCVNDLSQIFVFMAGLSAKLAERMSILMNSHLATLDLESRSSPSRALTRLMASGLREADNNDLRDINLCLHYMYLEVKTSDDLDRYQRLISMNKAQLVSLSILQYSNDADDVDDNDDGVDVKFIKEVVSVQTCSQLQDLTLLCVNLGEHELVLPDNITYIELFEITMTGGLSVQHCSQLLHLTLKEVNLGKHELVLPDNITHIELVRVTMTGGLSVQRCSQLQHLTLTDMNLGEHDLVLPDSITHIELVRVTVTGGLSVQRCSQLQHLTLTDVNLGNHELVLLVRITHIKLTGVTMTGGLSVQQCSQLQHLTLKEVNLGEHELVLPDNITHIELVRVTVTGGLSVQQCTQLQRLTLTDVNLGKHKLVMPDNITHITLEDVTMTGGLSVQHCTQLQHLKLMDMNVDDNFPQLPISITNIVLWYVTLPVRGVLGLLGQLENLPHAVTCKLEDCTVEPSSEHGHVLSRLQASASLQFDYKIEKRGKMTSKCWK